MRRSLLWGHLTVTFLGVAVVVWQATPMYWAGLFESPTAGVVMVAVMSAAVFGGVGGLAEGLAARAGWTGLALAILVVAAVPALWFPVILNGRLFGGSDPVSSQHLSSSVGAWLLFAATIFVMASVLAHRPSAQQDRRRTSSPAGGPGGKSS